ncbi:helicase with SNF2 domain [Spiroplasma clarkii]|nr:helicase with SNF2 domain [Spiroplasma clarkii]
MTLDMENSQENAYVTEVNKLNWSKVPKDSEILGLLQRLRPISNGIFKDDKYLSNKFKWIRNYLKDIESDEKILILSNFSNKTLSILHDELKTFKPLLITGSTPQMKRVEYINKIQNGKSKLLISNLKCIKEGVTLDKLDTLIFVDRSWTPADNEQAIMRFLPPTKNLKREKNKQIIDLISYTTRAPRTFFNIDFKSIDSYIVETLSTKSSLSKNLNNMKFVDDSLTFTEDDEIMKQVIEINKTIAKAKIVKEYMKKKTIKKKRAKSFDKSKLH